MGRVSRNRPLKELMLYICHKCRDDTTFTIDKLMLILFKIDQLYYRSTGKSLTGTTYYAHESGPVSHEVLNILKKCNRFYYD